MAATQAAGALGREAPRHSVWSNIAFVLAAMREYDRWLVILLAVNILFAAASQVVPVAVPKTIIDALTHREVPATIVMYSTLFGVLLLVTSVVSSGTNIAVSSRFVSVRLRLLARSGAKFMTMDFQNLEDPKILDLSQRGDRACNTNAVGLEGVMHRVQGAATKALTVACTGAVVARLSPLVAVALIALLALNLVFTSRARVADKEENDLLAPVWRRLGYLSRTMSDFSCAKDIRLFSLQGLLRRRYQAGLGDRLTGQCRIWLVWARNSNAIAVTNALQEVLLYAWLCWCVLHHTMNIGSFAMYTVATRTFSGALGGVLDDVSHIRQQNEVICDYREFLDYPDVSEGREPLPDGIADAGTRFEFQDVAFRYPGQDRYVMKGLSFAVNAGEKLAIVGLNGAGKTTLIKLLTRLYEPESGRILLNGVDARRYSKREYYRLFSTVFQDTELFAFTLAENVSMTEYASTSIARVGEAIDRAGLGERVRALPKGVDQVLLRVVEADGVELSGGEKQRLSLARALYKDASVVILDEPTAALDPLAEERLYRQFSELTSGKTAIYISHRLASTRFCDRIAVFEDGGIIECGTHSELMRAGGRYAELFSVQAKYYNEGEPA